MSERATIGKQIVLPADFHMTREDAHDIGGPVMSTGGLIITMWGLGMLRRRHHAARAATAPAHVRRRVT